MSRVGVCIDSLPCLCRALMLILRMPECEKTFAEFRTGDFSMAAIPERRQKRLR